MKKYTSPTTTEPFDTIQDSYKFSDLRYTMQGARPLDKPTKDESRVLNNLLAFYERAPADIVASIPTKQNVVGIAFAEEHSYKARGDEHHEHNILSLTPTTPYQDLVDSDLEPRNITQDNNIVRRQHDETLDDVVNGRYGNYAAVVNHKVQQAMNGAYTRRTIPVSKNPYRCILTYADKNPGGESGAVRDQ